jgi:hypothetical protein
LFWLLFSTLQNLNPRVRVVIGIFRTLDVASLE